MNPQNPNEYQGQPLQQGYPPSPQQSQVYGPQQYSPMPVAGGDKPNQTPPKNNKKIILAVVVLAVLLVVTIIAAVFMNLQNGNSGVDSKISRTYDSPTGLLPGMQANEIRSGTFKLTASYVTGGDFTREGTFTVDGGHMAFDMVSDDTKVNELMKYLYDRSGSKVPFDAGIHGVSRFVSYDFASMLGYHYLYDANAGSISGFIPAVEAAKVSEQPDARYTLTTTCDRTLSAVKEKTKMTTTGLIFETRQEGVNKLRTNVSFATLREIDKTVIEFFDGCYDMDQPQNAELKKFVDGLRSDVTKSPVFTYWQENGVNHLEVSAPSDDTPFGGKLHFELSKLGTEVAAKDAQESGSYVERRNQFGLAYSLCRTDPVITTTQNAGYRFMREDPEYKYPAITDSGYYCTTLKVPTQYSSAERISLRSTTGEISTITGNALLGLRGWHDLVYETEQYNTSNKRFPGAIEFRDMANSNMGTLTTVTQAIFADNSLTYTPAPAGCVGTCNDFILGFVPAPNVQVQRTTYKP